MTKDLTTGKIMPILIRFTIPLVLGNLFQLTYNAVDSIIVGHFVGKEALAAVGICNPISTLMILFLNGLCMGASILMGMQYGAKDYDTLHRQISTTMLSGVIFSLILSTACILFARPILILMQADAGILSLTTEYLQIIFEALCCVFCVIYIQKKVPLLRLGKKWLVFDRSLLMRTIAYGWTSALQQATVQLGKLGIQAIVNTMGVSVAAAFAIVNRIDDFAYTPEQNIAHAMTALMAQNKGAGKKDRMREGFRCGMILEIIYGLIVFALCFLFAREFMLCFIKDEEVIGHGVIYLHLISILPAVTNGIQGYFRGIGDLKITLISSFVNMGIRVLAAAPLVFKMHLGIEALPYSYLAGWIAMLIVELPLLLRKVHSK